MTNAPARYTIRAEAPSDIADIHGLNRTVFPDSGEADLVDRLRSDGDLVLSLIAVSGDRAIGHVAFSRMSAPFPALGLGPLAVTPNRAGQGIGSALVRRGLDLAAAASWRAVFVLGAPEFYSRFGFSAEAARSYDCPYAGPYLMLRALTDVSLPPGGQVDYAAAFSNL